MKQLFLLAMVAVMACGMGMGAGTDASAKGLSDYLENQGVITEEYYPNISVRGRMHLDAGWHDEDEVSFGDGFNARRARMGMSGSLDPNWSFTIEYDFAEENVGARAVMLNRSLYGGNLKIGQFKVPMGLNELTSSNNITFIERASSIAPFTDAFRMGLGYDYHAGFYGVQSMVYGRSMGDKDDEGGEDMPMGVGGRVYVNPLSTGSMMVHLGLSAAYEDRQDYDTISFSDRPEARADSAIQLIGTGDIDNVDSTFKGGLELAFQRGPFSMEAEYMMVDIDNDNDDPTFDGYHVQASYLLTGESRSYRNGVFGGVTPANETLGAWEVAARYSHVDLNDSGVDGGEQENITLGVNYYARSNVRFMANYIFVDVEGSDSLETDIGDDSPNIFLVRAQYSF